MRDYSIINLKMYRVKDPYLSESKNFFILCPSNWNVQMSLKTGKYINLKETKRIHNIENNITFNQVHVELPLNC